MSVWARFPEGRCCITATPTLDKLAIEHLAALERLNRIITAFASMVSHETRSALVGVQGLSELIRDGGLTPDEVRECANDIFIEAQRMDGLIGEMFDLHRIESNQAPFRKALVDLRGVVRDATDKARERNPGLTIELSIAPAPLIVSGDPDRLKQAVQYVIGFCTRTARAGGRIWLEASVERGNVALTVGSNSLPAVNFDDWLYGRYERYEQRPSSVIGAGLGLAIARAIIELHGGQIVAAEKGEQKSEFLVAIPRAGLD